MHHKLSAILLLTALLLLLGTIAMAQEGYQVAPAGYNLSWSTVDGGGHTFSTGPGYSLGATIGQPDAGPVLAGPGYILAGGFWSGGPVTYRVYLPLVLRSHP